MESTFNNTPHVGGSTSGNSSKKGSGASTSSSFSSGSTGSVGSSSVSSSAGSSADKVSNQASNFIDKVKNVDYQQQLNMLKERATPAYDASVDYVKTNPMLAVGGAALVGFFAGMLFCRK